MPPKMILRLGTRSSPLALWQAHHVRDALVTRSPELRVEIVPIRTTGDQKIEEPLPSIGVKGLFTREIETALVENQIDLAVHSLKDLPTATPEGLQISAILKRTHGGDALISKNKITLAEMPPEAIIATGSLRRRAQLLHFRPDFQIVNIRGNVNTRLEKFYRNDWHGMILAEAGIIRLERETDLTERIPFTLMLPAPGQGALAVETRKDDPNIESWITPLDDKPTALSVCAERGFLKRLEGGCQIPIAARAELRDHRLILYGLLADLDGRHLIRSKMEGSPEDAENIGIRLAEHLLQQGGSEILEEIRSSSSPETEKTS